MSCSIIIPTYNRKKFEKLIEFNILNQTYKNIIEVLIADDGDESQELDIKVPYPIKYIRCSRTTIGNKRNVLVNEARGEFIAHFDTDDIYFPQFIESSIKLMIDNHKNATGTSDMIFLFKDGHTGGMRNPFLSMANEATLVYKKSFWEKKNFSIQQTNEGIHFLEGRHWEVGHSNINQVMICLCHEENTVNKEVWRQPNNVVFPDYTMFKPILIDLGFTIKD
jgi:glycosyltransferase involved in cell wall biosynthesis